MNTSQTTESDFSHLNALLEGLNQTLKDEYTAVKNGEVEELNLLIEQKAELLRNIEGISKRVEPALEAAQKSAAEDASQNASLDIPSYVQTALENLISCHKQNQINGGSIEANRRFSESLLDIMTARETNAKTYDASGKYFNNNQAGALSAEA